LEIFPSKWLEQTIAQIEQGGEKKRLLLHACCAPCSSYVLEYLHRYFEITLFYYNPNITPQEEYVFRGEELKRLAAQMLPEEHINVMMMPYDPTPFYQAVQGREEDAEGGARCRICYALRLEETAKAASSGGYDYFTTTLSISPYKNAVWLNDLGAHISERYDVPYLFSDFKKKNGYKRSCELSAQYGLYRQDYCGCEFSKRQQENKGRKTINDNKNIVK